MNYSAFMVFGESMNGSGIRWPGLALLMAGLLGCMPSGAKSAKVRYEEGRSMKQVYPEKARDYFEAALRADPEFADAHLELGYLYEDVLDDPNAAIYHYQKFLELRPDSLLRESTLEFRITNCIQELTSESDLQLVIQQMESDLQAREQEVKKLTKQVDALENKLKLAKDEIVELTGRLRRKQLDNIGQTPEQPTSVMWVYHEIQEGETIYSIARKHGVTENEIFELNPGINPRKLSPGDKIAIPR